MNTELARLGLGNAVDELDTAGEGFVGDLAVGDVHGDDVSQLASSSGYLAIRAAIFSSETMKAKVNSP